ncbi:MAG: cupin domain-containing protein [Rhodospirillales bacterium]|nr:cupin domain-containing protein [Rhodospirillales bacterium]
MIASGNVFAGLPDARDAERVETLAALPRARIERIVSRGQASPEGLWYDQDQTEFVVLLAGTARLRIAGEAAPRPLAPGDWLVLPAHCRHLVEETSAAPAAVWLAVHLA